MLQDASMEAATFAGPTVPNTKEIFKTMNSTALGLTHMQIDVGTEAGGSMEKSMAKECFFA